MCIHHLLIGGFEGALLVDIGPLSTVLSHMLLYLVLGDGHMAVEGKLGEHLPGCKYVPLQCPNMWGDFELDFMEDHMKICRLEEVGCEFSGVGSKV